jgi:hypothetical protein
VNWLIENYVTARDLSSIVERSVLEQAIIAHRDGASMRCVVRQLKNDPGDDLAAAIASLGIALGVASIP